MTATTPDATSRSLAGSVDHRRADIQGLRAVAVLAVVAFHAGLPIPGGFVGVDVFFVISGFVITALILRRAAEGRFSYAAFYASRAKRLLPALAVMVAVTLVLALCFLSPLGPQETTASTAIGAMLLSANVVIVRTIGGYFSPEAQANPLLHTWSLSVEEQFYLVFPLLIVLCLRRSRRVLIIWVAALLIVSFLIGLLLSFGVSPFGLTSQPEAWGYYLAPSRAWEFAVGALAAITLSAWGSHLSRRTAVLAGWVGALLIAVSLLLITEATPFPGVAALLPVGGTLLLIMSGSVTTSGISGALSTRPMVRIGDWSYSIYLWHWPIIVIAVVIWPGPLTPILAAIFSFIPAVLSYALVENPLRIKPVTSVLRVGVTSAMVSAIVIAMAFGLRLFGSDIVIKRAGVQGYEHALTLGRERGCLLLGTAFRTSDIDRCTFTVEKARGTIVLAGDSHADALSTAVITGGNDLGYNVVSITGARCPLIRRAEAYLDTPNCSEMNRTLFEYMAGPPRPVLVVLAQADMPPQTDATLKELRALGIPVLYVRDVPRWRPFGSTRGPDPCTGGLLNFTCAQPYERIAQFGSAMRASEDGMLARHPEVRSYDPWPRICTPQECSAIIDGRLGYWDDDHLNAWGSAALANDIGNAIGEAIGSGRPAS